MRSSVFGEWPWTMCAQCGILASGQSRWSSLHMVISKKARTVQRVFEAHSEPQIGYMQLGY